MKEPLSNTNLDEFADDDGIAPVQLCLICRKRGIWMRHVAYMINGRRCICSSCGAIHIMEKHKSLTVTGFRDS